MTVRVSTQVSLERKRVALLSARVDRLDLRDLDAWIEAFISSGQPHQIVTANLDFLALARKRPAFADVLSAADLVLCDGKPLQWAARLQGRDIPARLTGTDLLLRTAALSATHGYRLFLLGAAPGVAEAAARRLGELVPGVVVAGCYTPPMGAFDQSEDQRMVTMIRAAHADALFVALGAPRQDEWIAAHLDELGVPLCAGVGAVFDFLAGTARRAPAWMQRTGLEWCYRMAREPGRLWRRYLISDLPTFFVLVARQAALRARSAGAPTEDETGDGTGDETSATTIPRTVAAAITADESERAP
ncbi:MAG: WecB/TagA/CpsF family glycosyltransferase [Ktedonobacterales bacterium]|nr:WecB/TagA/CpsF family glycosyltransferase [Ktedonobacterales bacterium]